MPSIQLFVPNLPVTDGTGGGFGRFVELDIMDPDRLLGDMPLQDLCMMLGHGLAGTHRYGSHTPTRMSTAAHTALGAGWVLALRDVGLPGSPNWPFARVNLTGKIDQFELAIRFMIHDAAEGLGLGDVPTPYKHALGLEPFKELEVRLCASVARRLAREVHRCGEYDLDPSTDARVQVIDHAILVDETRALMPGPLGPYWDFIKDLAPLGLCGSQFLTWLTQDPQGDLCTLGWAWGTMLYTLVQYLHALKRLMFDVMASDYPSFQAMFYAPFDVWERAQVHQLDVTRLPEHLAARVRDLLQAVGVSRPLFTESAS